MVKILFMVDDDADDRAIFQEAVQYCHPGIELLFASDGVEALERLEQMETSPDVIFLDYNMPRMNGLECLKKLKENHKFKDIPTVMYTTSGDREQERVLLFLGAAYYMKKTASFKGLCDELKRVINHVGNSVSKLQ